MVGFARRLIRRVTSWLRTLRLRHVEQFPPPRNPSESVAAADYPATHRFLRHQVDMQVADLRVLFRLPVAQLDPYVGCNFTAAAMMLNLISGFSRWFFHTDEAAQILAEEERRGWPLSRQRFMGFVEAYWPRVEPEPPPRHVAERLYGVRNSLAHDLGVGDSAAKEAELVGLAKRPMPLDDIVYLERAVGHPLTAPVIEEREDAYVVHLAGVYWAMNHMLREALQDRPAEIEAGLSTVRIPVIEDLAES